MGAGDAARVADPLSRIARRRLRHLLLDGLVESRQSDFIRVRTQHAHRTRWRDLDRERCRSHAIRSQRNASRQRLDDVRSVERAVRRFRRSFGRPCGRRKCLADQHQRQPEQWSGFHFDPATNTWTAYQVGAEIDWGDNQNFHNVGYVAVSADGHVWATHQVLSGLVEFDGTSWTLHTECSAQLDGLLPDPNGNIWIASAQQGLWRWNGTTCANWPTLGGDMTILAMSFDEPSNTLYAANFVGGIFYTTNDGGTFDTFIDGDGIIPIGVHPRPNGDVWVAYNQLAAGGSQGGVVHYDSAATRIEAFNAANTGLPSYFIDR